MNDIQLSMNTFAARNLSTQIADREFIQDGLDESGNEVEASEDAIQMYDRAIRIGDIPYLDWMTSTYRHYDVPILQVDPFTMLEDASHEALLWLDEQEYIVLPDIVRAIIYDDPLLLDTRDMTVEIVKQILLRGAWEIFLEYHLDILRVIHNTCMDTPHDCNILMEILSDIRPEEGAKYDILRELLKDNAIEQQYNRYIRDSTTTHTNHTI
jgi:hypothetical protein